MTLYFMTRCGYPVLKEDIFFAKIQSPSGMQIKICNTTTEKDFRPNPATVVLLDMCVGTHSVDEIIDILSEQCGEPREELTGEVEKILELLQEKNIITFKSTPLAKRIPAAKKVNVRYPIEFAQVEVTNRCNLSCVHCANDSGDPLPDELTTQEIFSLIDTLSSMGVRKILLTGGEPLLNPDIFKIAEHARKSPMHVIVFTNATLITEKHIKKFKKAGVNRFGTSIDSMDEDVHDTFRGQKGALKRALHGITLLQKAGFPIEVNVSIAQINKDHLVDILKYFKELNLTNYKIAAVRFSGRGIESVVVSPEEFYQVLVDQFTYFKEEFPEEIPHVYPGEEEGCGIARDIILIKADGTILPCPGATMDMAVGTIRDVNLEEFWDNNETLEMLRNIRIGKDSTCAECRFLAFCEGCVANAFLRERRFRCYDPYTCAHYRAYEKVFGTAT
ncbi:MAG: hypothetical protein AYK19_12845 [Theionarchaea archaeon DG-70-1]|nr:MAG: hypothetical protein AYK19_12845 [Theionarchaea archaeon DG-70-1]